jgi:asparagine synthase (glutamine-hydrolysing)
MCGIIGIFGRSNATSLVEKGIGILKNRGTDGRGIYSYPHYALGHCLHSVVGHVKQPIKGKGVLVSNCELYNWKELNSKYRLNAKNDAEVLLKLLDGEGLSCIEELDGVYSFAYLWDNVLYLARDIIGVKPLWYSHVEGFAFASEKKVLEKLGYVDAVEMNPRDIVRYDVKSNELKITRRRFFSIEPKIKKGLDVSVKEVRKLLQDAIEKRIPQRKFGILFSGGIDSTFIALTCKKLGLDFCCYTASLIDKKMKEPEDVVYARKVAKRYSLPLKTVKIKTGEVPKYLRKIVPLIEDTNVVKVGVGLTLFVACEQAREDECKVIFSGLGSEEIFAGYQRHKDSLDVNKEFLSGLLKMYERDLYRDDVITMHHKLELRVPFLDHKLVKYCLRIPQEYKITEHFDKHILRKSAEEIGMDKEFAYRKKRAAQYGSNFHKALKKLTKQAGLKYISEYLRRYYPSRNLRLGALISSGKDSLYAAYVMMRQNYAVECFITMKSSNEDSYMFHTPNVDLVRMQTEAAEIPLVEGITEGRKEEELEDLKKLIADAKRKHKLNGIITGALYSTYQRDRIEKVCDSLGLKIFSPLWHLNQETEMREILRNGFKIIFSSIAAYGLDKSWLGRTVDEKDVDKLVQLNKKIGINIAGEGGEFESLVLDCPMFKKKIKIVKSKMIEENKNTARIVVEKAILIEKQNFYKSL